jgi:tungstate transport system substrate-binding protein
MMITTFIRSIVLLSLPWLSCCDDSVRDASTAPVRVAVIGGMTTTGLWQFVAEDFTKRTGIAVELAISGPKEEIDAAFRAGGIDLFTMHSSDTATALVADGLAVNLRPWAFNELVIVGPVSDPAGIRGTHDGAAALRVIAEKRIPFVEARNTGSQSVSNTLWRKLGIQPSGDWLLKDGSGNRWDVVSYAASRGAYVIVGRIPVITGRLPAPGMEVMVSGDPAMRRPFVVAEAVAGKSKSRNPVGARRLADYLTSSEGQQRVRAHSYLHAGSGPLFFPVHNIHE